jgi:hypothetical protein
MKACRGSGGVAPVILSFNTSLTSWPLYPVGRRYRYPLNRRLDGPQNLCGRFGEEKNLLPLPGFETRTPARSLSHQFDYALPARYSLRILRRWANLLTQLNCHTKMLPSDCDCARGCETDWSTIKSQWNAATLRWYSRQRFPLSALRNCYISQHLSPQ